MIQFLPLPLYFIKSKKVITDEEEKSIHGYPLYSVIPDIVYYFLTHYCQFFLKGSSRINILELISLIMIEVNVFMIRILKGWLEKIY